MIVFVVTVVAAFNLMQEQRLADTEKAQLAACERGNTLRKQLNLRGEVVQKFFQEAANTRKVQGDIATSQGKVEEAAINYNASDSYQRSADAYTPLKFVDCEKSFASGKTVFIDEPQ